MIGPRWALWPMLGAVASCAAMTAATPIERPPAAYQGPTTFVVETLPAERVAVRCLERGLLLPAVACGNADMVTMPDPCALKGDHYADLLCHEQARGRGWGTK